MFAQEFPAFSPHLEVWVLVGSIAVMGVYVARVLGPHVVEPGERTVSRRQVVAFWSGLAFMTAASVWPMHDIAEQRLYSAHMLQHLILTLVVPPLFLLSCPTWLAELLVRSDGRVWHVIRFVAKPVLAWAIFNVFNLVSHMQGFVNLATSNGPFHFTAHVIFVVTALIMWIPVCGPWPSLRLSLPGQMVYLFCQSIIPTLPAAWLANSGTVVYSSYDQPIRLWHISALEDQTAAGLIMKLLEAVYLWAIIAFMFFKWAGRHLAADRQGLVMSEREIAQWEGASGARLSDGPVADAAPSAEASRD